MTFTRDALAAAGHDVADLSDRQIADAAARLEELLARHTPQELTDAERFRLVAEQLQAARYNRP